MSISLKNAENAIKDILRAGLVPNLLGSPGVGKSDLIRKIAKDFNLKVIDFRAAQSDPTDFLGMPVVTTINGAKRLSYAPPITFPLEEDTIPEGYKGWLVFFDELNTAANAVQAAAYKVLLDRQVGDHNLHKKVAMVCAGNLATDKAITNRLSTAMQSRLITLETKVNHKDWIEWAIENKINFQIISYLRWKPDVLHKFNPSHNELTFPCPRTWAFTSKLADIWGGITRANMDVLIGTIGKAATAELITYCEIFQTLPSITTMVNNPDSIVIDSHKKDIMFALSSLISKEYNDNNSTALMSIIHRLPLEFQVITIQLIVKVTPDLLMSNEIKAWRAANKTELL